MIAQTQKELFKELVLALGDFYVAEAGDFIRRLPDERVWYGLRASQIKNLQEIFATADKRNKNRKAQVEKFLQAQAEREGRKDAESGWRRLESNLPAFLFRENKEFFEKLQTQVEALVKRREQSYPDSRDIQFYLTAEAEPKSEIYHWQRDELLPLITQKLFYTLITLHRLHNAECYKERKEWLRCLHSTH